MTRNLKAFGLALLAGLSMSAMTASVAQASASPKFTAAEYPAFLDATGNEGEKFTAFGAEVTCKDANFEGVLTEASNELTVIPTYSECHSLGFSGLEILSVTVTTNGCGFKKHHPTTHKGSTSTHHFYTFTINLVCPNGKPIEFHIYRDFFHLETICTLTIGSQNNLEGLTADVHTKPTPQRNDVTYTGKAKLKAQLHRNSAVCPGVGSTPETSEATYHLPAGGVTTQATNEAEEFIDLDIG